jgi:hypothetical protein
LSEVIIPQPNFGCETLFHLPNSDTSLFASGLTVLVGVLEDQEEPKENDQPLSGLDNDEPKLNQLDFTKSDTSYSSIVSAGISFIKRDSGLFL